MSQQGEQPVREAAFFTTIRSWGLTRGDHGIVGGVIDGLGERVGLARVPARLIFVVIALVTAGFGLLAYAAGWGLLPDRHGNIIIQNFGRGVTNVGALLGIAVLTVLGLGGIPDGLKRLTPWSWTGGWPWNGGWSFGDTLGLVWWFVIVGGLTWLVIYLIQRGRNGTLSPQPHPGPVPGGDATGASGATPGAEQPAPVYAALPGEAGPATAGWEDAARASAHAAGAQAASEAQRQAWDAQRQAQQAAWQAQHEAHRQAADAQRQAHVAAVEARRRARIPGPGSAGYLTALAWLILSGVGLWIAERNDLLAVHPFVAWPVAVLIGWGAILVVISLMGRRLGFLGVLTVLGILPVLIIGSASTQFRDNWDDGGGILPHWGFEDDAQVESEIKAAIEGWVQDNIDPDFDIDEAEHGGQDTTASSVATATPEADATIAPLASFADYSDVLLRGDCYDATALAMENEGSTEQIALSELAADRTLTLSAENTLITVPTGTPLEVVAEGDAQVDVEWASRQLWCSVAGEDTALVSLTAAEDAPTLTLVISDDAVTTVTINEIEE
ncbi:PspC domain-containing protein [Demequina salsinemoris]|uniref:PspC domain-containing protein n=1 Tax=Demequina salsinemoris TaxID=577470 RepID=UPI0007854972|nr:PspC domain-containing protein [Demequina salsinemoris]